MKIKKHLPKKEATNDAVMIHTWVNKTLRDKVNKKREQLNITWSDLQEAMYRAFLEECASNTKEYRKDMARTALAEVAKIARDGE